MSLKSIKSSRVLLSPLNRGWEYTSRTVPIIRVLLQHQNEVYICCNEEQEDFYREYFPELWYIPHHGYPASIIIKGASPLLVFSHFWLIKSHLRKEKIKVAEWVAKFQPDVIISDQRLGFFSEDIKSILISHLLKSSLTGGSVFQRLWNKYQLSKFDEVWIPDTPERKYTKKLTQGNYKNKHFLGTCSRFQNDAIDKLIPKKMRYKYLGIINDSLPTSEEFLKLLFKKLSQLEEDCAIVLPKALSHLKTNSSSIKIIIEPDHDKFIELMLTSKTIISRPNYTTIMDILETQNRTLFIPDTSQKEHLYYAKIHERQPNWNFKSEIEFSKMKL